MSRRIGEINEENFANCAVIGIAAAAGNQER
jgi:hypothetical protein